MKFLFKGAPIAKARPRLGKWGVYDAQSAQAAKIRMLTLHQMLAKDLFKVEGGPLEFVATFYMPIPTKCSRTAKKALEGRWCPKNKDVDNIAKFYLDCLNKLAYEDDRQVTRLVCEKVYSDTPRVEIEITELEPDEVA